jgi:hypothetical protein
VRARPGGWTETGAIAALWAAGVVHWAFFFGLGRGPAAFSVADWPKEYRYYSALREAIRDGRVPYYVTRPIHETRKLLALPELTWSPQVLLLRVLDVPAFVTVNTVLLYTAGFAGCLLLRRRYDLSALPFALLVMLSSFNGHLVAHLAVGHSMWAGTLLLPLFAYAALELVDDPARARTPLLIALVLFALSMQGAFHALVWCVLFLLLVAAWHAKRRGAVLRALAWTLALCACRLVPPAVVLLGRRQQPFLSGYQAPTDLIEALARLRTVTEPLRGGRFGALGWWEYDAYVGVAGLVWLVWFGIVRRVQEARRAPTASDAASPAASAFGAAARARWALDGPITVMVLLSLDDLYYPINAAGLPLFSSQRVSSRLLLVPLILLTVVAAARTQADLQVRRRGLRLALGVAALLTVASLAAHSWTWRVAAVEAAWPPAPHPRDLSIDVREEREEQTARDRAYVAAVRLSAAVSAGSLAAVAWRLRRLRGRSYGARRDV